MTTDLLQRVDHLGIAVQDLDAAIQAYAVLGVTDWERIALPERAMLVAVARVGTTLLELICPTSPEAAFARFLSERGEGLHHVAYAVADIDAALAELAAQGVRLIDHEARPGIHNTRVAFVHPKAMHGVLVELVEHQGSAPLVN